MKIAFLAPANSIHTQRWVAALCGRGHEVTLFSQHRHKYQNEIPGLNVEWLPFQGASGYFLNALHLKKCLAKLDPDLLNAHYASGYGTTAALCNFQPTLLSVWGSDVFDFPFESRLKMLLIRWNLHSASRIASTSQVMARQVKKLVPRLLPALVTPFGVDCQLFREKSSHDDKFVTIGTVKTLAHKYGIDLLIEAFSILVRDAQLQELGVTKKMRLLLVGGGSERNNLEELARSLGVYEKTVFSGHVNYAEVPNWLHQLDIYVAASRLDSESFGVAAVEAGACGLPVVVSDAGGLPEVVLNGITGLVVPREDVLSLAEAIKQLVLDANLRIKMGAAGRLHVLSNYEWEHCVTTMEAAYKAVLTNH